VLLYHSPPRPDPFLSWSYALATQLAEYLSISSACGPYLRPLLENLASGMIFNDDIRRNRDLKARILKGPYSERSGDSSRNKVSSNGPNQAQRLDLNLLPRPDCGPHRVDISSEHGDELESVVSQLDSSAKRANGASDVGRGGITQIRTYLVEHGPAS
jgi:hypothetical protein